MTTHVGDAAWPACDRRIAERCADPRCESGVGATKNALGDGAIGIGHAKVIARAIAKLPRAEHELRRAAEVSHPIAVTAEGQIGTLPGGASAREKGAI